MHPIERQIRSITEDRRAGYLFATKTAAAAVGCHPNKFGDWWARTQSKLIALYQACPGELAAELAAMIALAEAQRQADQQRPADQAQAGSGRRVSSER